MSRIADVLELLATKDRGVSTRDTTVRDLIMLLKFFDKKDKKKDGPLKKEDIEKLIKEKTEVKMPTFSVSQLILLSLITGPLWFMAYGKLLSAVTSFFGTPH